MSLRVGSLAHVPLPSLVPKDKVFFDLFNQAGQNTLRAAKLLQEMLDQWPDEKGLQREILLAEQEGDKITHDIIQRVQTTFVTPLDGGDIYSLATQLDDIVDYIDETAEFLGLYNVEAPMEQSQELALVLLDAARQLEQAMPRMRNFGDIHHFTGELHRLEHEGDRLTRKALAALFEEGVDPMVVIRWKDIVDRLEAAIDSTERVGDTLESIVIKNS
jgi:uncharacterized protein